MRNTASPAATRLPYAAKSSTGIGHDTAPDHPAAAQLPAHRRRLPARPDPQIIVVTPEPPKADRLGILTGLSLIYNLTALAPRKDPAWTTR